MWIDDPNRAQALALLPERLRGLPRADREAFCRDLLRDDVSSPIEVLMPASAQELINMLA